MNFPPQDTCIFRFFSIKEVLLFILILLSGNEVFCQQNLETENLTVTAFTNENGLRQSMVSQICQDEQGLIWMVTGDGLHYFDGQEFKAFRVPYNGIYNQKDNIMRFLVASRQGELVLTSTSSLLRFNSSSAKFEIIYRKEGNYPIVFNTSIGDNPLVWMRGLNFCILKNSRLVPLQLIPEQGSELPADFVPEQALWSGSDEILICGERGLLALQIKNHFSDSIFTAKWIPVADCRSVTKTRLGKILVLANGKIFTWHRNGTLTLLADTKLNSLQYLYADSRDNIWLSDQNSNKMYRYTEGKIVEAKLFTRNGKSTEPLTPSVISMFEDREHNLWFGTDGNGLLLYSPGQVQFHKSNIGFIRCVTGYNKNIWAGTYNNGLWEFNSDLSAVHRINQSHFSNSGYFLDLTPDNSGRLWIAARDGLEVVNANGESIWKYSFSCLQAKFICHSGDSILLVCDNQLLRFHSIGKPTCYQSDKFIAVSAFLNVDGYYWIGTEYGLYRYSRKLGFDISLAFEQNQHKLTAIPVFGLLYRHGLIWVASGNGMLCFNTDGSVHKLSPTFNQLKNDVIYSILADSYGRLWITGNHGIGCVSPADDRIVFFNSKNNLQSLEFNYNAAYSASDGKIYLGGIQGLNCIDPDGFKPDRDPPEVKLISLMVSDSDYAPGVPPAHLAINLSRLSPHISGKVFSTDYQNSGSLLYSFYLEGYQEEWSIPSDNAIFNYRNLPPGKYRLFVKCADPYLNWSKPDVLLTFSISPAFYTTWWFLALLSSIILLITVSVVKRIQRLRYQSKIRELKQEFAIEKERLRISKDMHDEVGASLTRISILSELAKKQQYEPGKVQNLIEQISEISGDVVDEMSEIIWAMNPRNDTLDSFASYIRQHVSTYLESAAISGRFTFPNEVPPQPMSSELRRNLFLTVKEGIHNIVKHSGAKNVDMSLVYIHSHLEISIQDDGIGFEFEKRKQWGNGLINMRKRIEELGGNFEITSYAGEGTKIQLSVHMPTSNKSH